MFCPSCSNLSIKPLNPSNIDSTSTPKINCKHCGFPLQTTKSFYGCTSCKNYYLCVNCKVCPENHLLNKVYNLTKMGQGSYQDNIAWCDICSKEIKSFNYLMHCKSCQYDVCEACNSKC